MNSNVRHIGIIIDGNRRYAKKLLLQPWKGHDMGAERVENIIEWTSDLGIKILTIYALSTENLKREAKELEHLFGLFRKWFTKIRSDKRVKERQIKFKFIGRLELLPEDLNKLCREIEKDTENNKGMLVNFCMAYGGRQELIEAMKKIVESKQEITEENLRKNLWLQEEPELIIRTGNRTRTSNFLPWQSAYSEWIFLEKLWPEFTKQDLIECLEKFSKMDRNFGR